ncbi:MAG TPA: lactate utilization protein C [Burkholderiales bacterium]|nr:lactate utilization protein C [Burkholderiales bacterium]
MTDMSARDRIIARIRAAQGPRGEPSKAVRAAAELYISAHPQGPRPRSDWDPLVRFRERAISLSSSVETVASPSEAPEAVARYLAANALPLQAVCWPEIAGLGWGAAGVAVESRPARGDDLVGITGAFCAIAETGTLMLLSGPQTPAATSLLPETHIAVLSAGRILRGMEDAWALARGERGQLPRAVNFVSGPSRTADIEQTINLGAHGPYRVHIVIVAGA